VGLVEDQLRIGIVGVEPQARKNMVIVIMRKGWTDLEEIRGMILSVISDLTTHQTQLLGWIHMIPPIHSLHFS